MNIVCNGKTETVTAGMNLKDFLSGRSVMNGNCVVEYNSEVFTTRHDMSLIVLKSGDIINLFTVVAGG